MKQRKSVRNVTGRKSFPAHVNATWNGGEPKSTACGTTASAMKKKSVLSAAVPGMWKIGLAKREADTDTASARDPGNRHIRV